MENKNLTTERVALTLIVFFLILSMFFSNSNLNIAVNKIEKAKLEIDSAQRAITSVVKDLSDLSNTAQQTQIQLTFLKQQRDSLSIAFTDKIYADKWMLQKYVEQLSINKMQHDSIALLIKKFE